MLRLPDLDKNAHLYVLVNRSRISAHLAYGDYSIGRSYVLKDSLKIDSAELMYESKFWKDYFNTLEKVFNWNIFRGRSGEIMSFVSEGIGVTGVTVVTIDRQMSSHSIISSLRAFSQEIKVRMVGKGYVKELCEGISEKFGYTDITLLDLNLMDFSIYRSSRVPGKRNLSGLSQQVFEEGRTIWSSKGKLMEAIRGAKLRAFLSIEATSSRLSNTWANFVLTQAQKASSEIVTDMLRAYTTVQLLDIANNNEKKFSGIGKHIDGTAIVLTGELVSLLPRSLLIMSVLDGLEITGGVDIFIDDSGVFYTLGKNYTEGVSSREFIASAQDIVEEAYKVYVPEIDGKKNERKVIFSGVVDSEKGERDEVFAVAPELSFISLKFPDVRMNVEGSFLKGAYLDNYGERVSFISNPEKVWYKGIVMDGRYKPVVYGPEPRVNRDKISEWFDENTW